MNREEVLKQAALARARIVARHTQALHRASESNTETAAKRVAKIKSVLDEAQVISCILRPH